VHEPRLYDIQALGCLCRLRRDSRLGGLDVLIGLLELRLEVLELALEFMLPCLVVLHDGQSVPRVLSLGLIAVSRLLMFLLNSLALGLWGCFKGRLKILNGLGRLEG
jgi:hypothetical protein